MSLIQILKKKKLRSSNMYHTLLKSKSSIIYMNLYYMVLG